MLAPNLQDPNLLQGHLCHRHEYRYCLPDVVVSLASETTYPNQTLLYGVAT